MAFWEQDTLAALDGGDEIDITPRRTDGTLRAPVIIWAVRLGDGLYVRSARGPEGGWYRHVLASGEAVVAARGAGADVTVEHLPAGDARHAELDAAYHAKYDRYGPAIVGAVVGPDAAEVTLRLVPTA
ncbi:DUF2255 family protein [Microbacterium gorillae]|uniref:DUF2255 family protein n=1 Tax=Microbacterium gorillae TaxID=1231063 RepID=UPI0005904EC2|nr:DUF2255 family protein [Microbacterium gorillae]